VFVYLTVAPTECDIVDFADGSQIVTSRGNGAAVAATAGDPSVPVAVVPDERLARQQAAHREWAERLDRALDASTSITHARMIREAFVAENPEPAVDGAIPDDSAHPVAQVSEGRWWCARVGHPDVGFETWLADADSGYPLAGVAAILGELGDRGWDLRHVAEDRRAVHDGTSSRAELIGARFLLHRRTA
jgi:hypothetical protein